MNNAITIGSRLAVEVDGRIKCYEVVASDVNPSEGRVSFRSPLGAALLGRHIGDRVRFKAPGAQELDAEIVEVWPQTDYDVLIF